MREVRPQFLIAPRTLSRKTKDAMQVTMMMVTSVHYGGQGGHRNPAEKEAGSSEELFLVEV